MHPSRLNSLRRLADTTAESETSVKRAHSIGIAGLHHYGQRGSSPNDASFVPASGGQGSEYRFQRSDLARPPIRRKFFTRARKRSTKNRLDEAERDFRRVIAVNPKLGAAYANLGVVYMRRKQWAKALEALRTAEHLMPHVAGDSAEHRPGLLPTK